MFEYTLTTWLLLFFIYSFLGWVWESCFVSFKQKKWVNRGFMSGPFLPIYGSGAIIVLFTTLPVQDSKLGIYIVGAISATLLELVVGYFTELIFHVRYWDYSYKKIQYKGYICLSSSLGWGIFSILLVDYMNIPIENFLAQYPAETLNIAAVLILIPFTMDATKSTRDALDLKKLLETMEANSETFSKLVNYVDEIQVKVGETSDEFKSYMENVKTTVKDEVDYNKAVNSMHKKLTDTIDELSTEISTGTKIKDGKEQEKLTDEEISIKQKALDSLKALNNKLLTNEFSIKQIDFKDFKGSINLLKRNPTANHKSLKDQMKKLTNMDSKKLDSKKVDSEEVDSKEVVSEKVVFEEVNSKEADSKKE